MDDVHFPPLARFRFRLRARAPVELPDYTGSTWRGLIGTALRAAVCVPRLAHCEPCLIQPYCAFFHFFEHGALTQAQDPRYRDNSAPFVLDVHDDGGRTVAPGGAMQVGVTLIGAGIDLVGFWVYAFQQAGELGAGKGRGQFALVTVLQEAALGSDDWRPIWSQDSGRLEPLAPAAVPFPPPPPALDVALLTPLRIKARGDWLNPATFTAADFLRQLCTRLDRIEQQFGHDPAPAFLARHRGAIEALPPAPAALRWHDWRRYSSRQQQHMTLGGLLGRFQVPAGALPELWPLLWLGQFVHVGKNTSFGLGQYRVEPADGDAHRAG